MASITNIPPNRVVALLTPTVFAPLAGAIAIAAAEVVPGTNIDETSITAIFIAGATIAFGKAAQWTKGWQAFEQRDADTAVAAPADARFDDDDAMADDLGPDLEDEAGFDDDDEDGPAELAVGEELAAFEDAEEMGAFDDEADTIEEELLAMSAADEE